MADRPPQKKHAKNKDGIRWFEPLSPESRGWWAWAACPEGWWVIQIPYALWHMLLEGLRGWGGVRSVQAWGVERGKRVCFFFWYYLVNGEKGCWQILLHTPYRRTQPPPPGDREREHKKEMGGKQKTQRQKTKRKARQVLETTKKHAGKS